MHKNRYILFFLAAVLASQLSPSPVFAQKNLKKNNGAQKQQNDASQLKLRAKVVDENGKPIPNAAITLGEGMNMVKTDNNGAFALNATINNTVLVEAKGYKSQLINLAETAFPERLVLVKDLYFDGETDKLYLPLGLTTTQRQSVGAISTVSGDDLKSYSDLSFSNVLQGRLMGLTVRQNTNGLGNNDASLSLRGLPRGGNDAPITIVDGIERPIDFLNSEEIESVEVLKDANSKILYGPRAANGVVLITTKRGKTNTRLIKVSADYGASMATRLPKFVNSYEYANLYNEARANDGLTPFYSSADIMGYQNSTGAMDQKYPNVDFYDYFLNKNAAYRKANLEYSGGDDNMRYAFLLGYNGANGFEKIGKTPVQDRINLRGNLDFKITPMLKAYIDANAIVETRSWGGLNQDQVFAALSSHRPNEYPIIYTDPAIANQEVELGSAYRPALGGSYLHPNNLYADLVYGGNTKNNFFFGQTNFGLDLNLDKVVKGLSVKSSVMFDNYQFFQQGSNEIAATYIAEQTKTSLGADTVVYNPLRAVSNLSDLQRQNETTQRNIGYNASINYKKQIGRDEFNANLSQFYIKAQNKAIVQDIINTNTALKLNYNINHKIYTEGTLALMGSNKFAKAGTYFFNGINDKEGLIDVDGNRFNLSTALGFSYILSEEDFLKNSKTINFLKLKSSFGILGFDGATDFYSFETRYTDGGTYPLNQPNAPGSTPRVSYTKIGNPLLDWEKSREINVGTEGLAFKNSLSFEFNYFNTLRYDIILNPTNQYSSVVGGLFGLANLGRTKNQGIEGNINYASNFGDLKYSFGGNFIFSKNKIIETNEVTNQPANLLNTGKSSDVIFGYNSLGLFKDQAVLNAAPLQTNGSYGLGDIQYQDVNKDGLIDNRDQVAIGNTFPRTTLGIDLNLNYKRFGVYILGTSELGVNALANNAYFRNNAQSKYSVLALDRYHPTNNPSGEFPRLTTYSGTNNNAVSSFWLVNANFLRLKNVELSYTIDKGAAVVKAYRFYVRGTNLLVLSNVKDLDPEALNAGVSNYPVYRTITGGVSVNF